MKPAEFLCAREFLGLKASWIASQLQVHPKTVNAWEEPGANVPQYAEAFMLNLLKGAEQAVGAMCTTKKKIKELPVPRGYKVPEGHPFPATYYRSIASRVAERTGCTIEYVE
jgi:hypothetical protein